MGIASGNFELIPANGLTLIIGAGEYDDGDSQLSTSEQRITLTPNVRNYVRVNYSNGVASASGGRPSDASLYLGWVDTNANGITKIFQIT